MNHAIAAALAVTTGCSFVMTQNPDPPPGPANCDPSRSAPLLDVVGVVTTPLVLGLTYAAVATNGANSWNSDDDAALGLIVATSMVTEIVAAVVGFSRTGRCEEAIDARMHNQRFYPPQQPYPPQGYPPQPYPPQPIVAPQEPPPGMERGMCRTDGSCSPGLTCASNRCVALPPMR